YNEGYAAVSGSFTDNSATSDGGGILNYRGKVSFSGILSGNSAGYEGGGVCHIGGTLEILFCTVGYNTAGNGGAIYIEGGQVRISDSTLSQNSAVNGGAIYDVEGNYGAGIVDIWRSTISDNSASSAGGGVYNGFGGNLYLFDHTAVRDNQAPLGQDVYTLTLFASVFKDDSSYIGILYSA